MSPSVIMWVLLVGAISAVRGDGYKNQISNTIGASKVEGFFNGTVAVGAISSFNLYDAYQQYGFSILL